jgi:ubiquitin C-terminal hydrolase
MHEFESLLERMENSSSTFVSPQQFLLAFRQLNPDFVAGEQDDSRAFFMQLLDWYDS